MIYDTDKHILKETEDFSVIVHQVSTRGTIPQGLGMAISKQYPEWYREYHGYCGWFMKDGPMNFSGKDHTDEIIGTWHRYQVPEKNLIICSAFAQQGGGKDFVQTDLDAWDRVLRKLLNQTKYVNKSLEKKWTIHIPSNLGAFGKDGDNTELMELFQKYFGDSEVDLYIHEFHRESCK